MDGWLQAENHDAAVGFYVKHLDRAAINKLRALVKQNELINEEVADNRITGWYNKIKNNKKAEERKTFTRSEQERYRYKTADELAREETRRRI